MLLALVIRNYPNFDDALTIQINCGMNLRRQSHLLFVLFSSSIFFFCFALSSFCHSPMKRRKKLSRLDDVFARIGWGNAADSVRAWESDRCAKCCELLFFYYLLVIVPFEMPNYVAIEPYLPAGPAEHRFHYELWYTERCKLLRFAGFWLLLPSRVASEGNVVYVCASVALRFPVVFLFWKEKDEGKTVGKVWWIEHELNVWMISRTQVGTSSNFRSFQEHLNQTIPKTPEQTKSNVLRHNCVIRMKYPSD